MPNSKQEFQDTVRRLFQVKKEELKTQEDKWEAEKKAKPEQKRKTN